MGIFKGITIFLNLSITGIYTLLCEEKVGIDCSIMGIYAPLCGEKWILIDPVTAICYFRNAGLVGHVPCILMLKHYPEVHLLKSSTTIVFCTERDL